LSTLQRELAMTWATDRLDAIKAGTVDLPPVVQTMKLGLIEDWGPGWVRKRWRSVPEILNVDGSMFGGYIAALADQVLAFAAMTVLPDDMMYRTAGLQVQFFRVTRGEPLTIEGRVISKSNTTIAVEAEFRADDELIAKASALQIMRPLRKSL
jgi:uncharacterized protein (TIGR00369 family)